MPIKQTEILSRADFDEAVVKLRLNVSEIAKETGIPRTYLSEYRNGDRKLRPEHLGKLRDYFENKGIEFDDAPAQIDPPKVEPPEDDPVSPHPRLRAEKRVRCYFAVADEVSDEVVEAAMNMRDDAEVRLATVLKDAAAKDEGIFSSGEFTDKAKESLQEAFALLAKIGLIELYVRGFRALNLKPSSERIETVRDVVVNTFHAELVSAGLIAADVSQHDTEESDTKEAA